MTWRLFCHLYFIYCKIISNGKFAAPFWHANLLQARALCHWPSTRSCAPWTPLGASSQIPIICLRCALAMASKLFHGPRSLRPALTRYYKSRNNYRNLHSWTSTLTLTLILTFVIGSQQVISSPTYFIFMGFWQKCKISRKCHYDNVTFPGNILWTISTTFYSKICQF